MPEFTAARILREKLDPNARLLLFCESRSYIFRGLDYVPYQPNEGPPVLHLFHRNNNLHSLRLWFQQLGVTHIAINTNTLKYFSPYWIEEYGFEEFKHDLALMDKLIAACSDIIYNDRGFITVKLKPVTACSE